MEATGLSIGSYITENPLKSKRLFSALGPVDISHLDGISFDVRG